MKPVDFSRQTFEQIRANLSESRERVHRAWLAHGPGTTRDIAAKAEIDILSFRPRSTELYELGLIELLEDQSQGHQGIYRARTLTEWEAYIANHRFPKHDQLSLKV